MITNQDIISKKYLVTGGAGFIGSMVAKALLSQGSHVTIIDNLSTGFKENIPSEAVFILGNCEDQNTVNLLNREKFDAIYHIAGQSSGEISFDNPVLDMQANLQSTLVLLKYAVETQCRVFIYASSMSVYGDAEHLPVSEQDATIPKSFYAVGKLASEHYLRIYRSFGIKTVALRLFNVYGAGQNLKNLRQGMASIYLAQAINTGKILVKGAVDRFRDFVHINDVVHAFLHAEQESVPAGIYNVCTGQPTYVRDILELISAQFEGNLEINITDPTPGDQFGIFGSTILFENTFGFKNEVSFQVGMRNMIHWAKSEIHENSGLHT